MDHVKFDILLFSIFIDLHGLFFFFLNFSTCEPANNGIHWVINQDKSGGRKRSAHRQGVDEK